MCTSKNPVYGSWPKLCCAICKTKSFLSPKSSIDNPFSMKNIYFLNDGNLPYIQIIWIYFSSRNILWNSCYHNGCKIGYKKTGLIQDEAKNLSNLHIKPALKFNLKRLLSLLAFTKTGNLPHVLHAYEAYHQMLYKFIKEKTISTLLLNMMATHLIGYWIFEKGP